MLVARKSWIMMAVTLLITAGLLAGCSDGGGSASGKLVDPSFAYEGESARAKVTSTNAEELTLNAYNGESLANIIDSGAKKHKNEKPAPTVKYPAIQIAQLLKQSSRRLEIARKAEKTAAAGRTSHEQVIGTYSGAADYNLDVNDSTGSFFGTVTYQNFNQAGMVFNGTAQIIGSIDPNWNEVSSLTLSFTSLRLSFDDPRELVLTGTLSWQSDFSLKSETLSMNMVLLDQDSGKTYWFNKYLITTVFSDLGISQTMTGRYYDHDHGYVDITSPVNLNHPYNREWPSGGTLLFSGASETWARLNFFDHTLVIEADTDGNGVSDWRIEHKTNTITPEDLIPVAAAGPDQTVHQWTTVHFDGSASRDPLGNTLTYAWEAVSWPDSENSWYFRPALVNEGTATPSFYAETAGTFVFSLRVYDGNRYSVADTVTVVVSPVTAQNPDSFRRKWYQGTYGKRIGKAGLFTHDLDGDGTPEIIASASSGDNINNNYFYVVKRTEPGVYEQTWRSPVFNSCLYSLELSDMNGDQTKDVITAHDDGTIRILDGTTMNEIRTLKVSGHIMRLIVADLDGDGQKEIVTTNGSQRISVYNSDSGALKWQAERGGGRSMAVGNVDTDPALEIVTPGFVVNGLTGAIKWEKEYGFGYQVQLGDLDKDGRQEIIGNSTREIIAVYDADLKSKAWETNVYSYIDSFVVADSDGDSIPEIIFYSFFNDKHTAIDAVTRSNKWSISNTSSDVYGVALDDLDGDGITELAWGTGSNSFLFIADTLSGDVEWQSQYCYIQNSIAVGDVDDDHEDEVVVISQAESTSQVKEVFQIYNARTHALEYEKMNAATESRDHYHLVKIGDVDGDGHTELVFNTTVNDNSVIRVFDGTTHAMKREGSPYGSRYVKAMALGDVDNDGAVEIVLGSWESGNYSRGIYLIVLNGVTLEEKWRSVDLGSDLNSSIHAIKITDLDKDGHPDIIASLTDNRLIVIDGVNHILKQMIECPARALALNDMDDDGFQEVLVGRNDGYIDVYDGVTFSVEHVSFSYDPSPIDILILYDLDGNGTMELLVANSRTLSVLQGIDTGMNPLWRWNFPGWEQGFNNRIAVKDVDMNGYGDIFVGSEANLYQFEFIGPDY